MRPAPPPPAPPLFRAQQSLLLFCCALQKCLLGWVRAGLPGKCYCICPPTNSGQKCLLRGPHRSFHTLWGLSLIHVPLDTVFYWIRGSQKTLGWQGPLGGHFVQSPAQSFTSRSSCSRSRPVELLKISKRYHRNCRHVFQCLTTFIGKFKNLSALSTFMVCSCFSACPCPLSVLHIGSYACGPSRDVLMWPL